MGWEASQEPRAVPEMVMTCRLERDVEVVGCD